MRKLVLSVVAASGLIAPAFAADVPSATKAPPIVAVATTPVFDIAFGGVVMSDYNFRGVSQSNRGPSGGAYVEPQFITPIGTLYVAVAGYAIDWPSGAGYGFTSPSAEIDFYGGWRNSWGPFSIDIGAIYYFYPKETFNGFTGDSDFWEVYGKLGYAITPDLSVGANVFYTPDLLNYGETFRTIGVAADASAVYASLTGKWVLPWKANDVGAFVSGELGHWWIDDAGFTNPLVGLTDPSYTYWNVGLGITYKAITLDLRYHGTDMSKADCGAFLVTGVPNRSNNWCDDTFIVALKFDTTVSALK
ncbi:MAG: hypothetical protein GEU91_23275 [Rhizobiales bacterium]|nr:hypothetical protein [Hyphomicrobiales bacterium]